MPFMRCFALAMFILAGCENADAGTASSAGGSGGAAGSLSTGASAGASGASGAMGAVAGAPAGGSAGAPLINLPIGGAGIGTSGGAAGGACEADAVLRAVVRDFRGANVSDEEPRHPDFQGTFNGHKGIVKALLGTDGTPEYASAGATPATTGPTEFSQWYHDVAGTNLRIEVELPLIEDAARPGLFVYDDQEFFPIDGAGFGNQSFAHNFHFTTELHLDFTYLGGEEFGFRGDDDVWVYINGRLAIDLGGVHPAELAKVVLDEQAATLGITPGLKYRLDIFQAERHTDYSTFRIETSLKCIQSVIVR